MSLHNNKAITVFLNSKYISVLARKNDPKGDHLPFSQTISILFIYLIPKMDSLTHFHSKKVDFHMNHSK